MRNCRFLKLFIVCFITAMLLVSCLEQPKNEDFKQTNYWAPAIPPRAHYTIDCRIDFSAGQLEGIEIIRFQNNASRAIHCLAFDWAISHDQTVEVMVNGMPLPVVTDSEPFNLPSPILYELPKPLSSGESIELNLKFSRNLPSYETQDKIKLVEWHPRLWWGFPTHDDFDVNLKIPSGYALATSGRLDRESGHYLAERVRSFGLFLAKDHQIIEANAEDVIVRCLVTPQREECARFLLSSVVETINFYRERFGFYPYPSLTLVPGSDQSGGGYPVATSIVAIHGQQRFSAEHPETHWWWQWITAHEIGHQYWLEYVLTKDPADWGWLMIGLGIHADQEYCRAREIIKDNRWMMERYISSVRRHLDTTVERPPEQLAEVDFDFNGIVVHSKGYSIVSALAYLLGQETFDRVYERCLKEFAGRQLGSHEFQVVCEEESKQNLAWFFDQWLRSNRYLSYEIVSQECTKQNGQYVSEVRVECLGTLKMPVPIKVNFQDGSQQLKFTDRLLDINVLRFENTSPLKEAQLDPDGQLALIVPPPSITDKELGKRVDQMEWTGVGRLALDLFRKAQEIKSADFTVWKKLGLTLYDGEYYNEALDAFGRAAKLTEGGAWVIVWQGHIWDLLGRREMALQHYQEALTREKGLNTQHDQYGITIHRQWVEERLKTPFRRR